MGLAEYERVYYQGKFNLLLHDVNGLSDRCENDLLKKDLDLVIDFIKDIRSRVDNDMY